jgi:hypothetical protein
VDHHRVDDMKDHGTASGFQTGRTLTMPLRPFLATTTGEPFQPARLHYAVRDLPGLEGRLRGLKCVRLDAGRNCWVWHYDAEARSLKFQRDWKEVTRDGPVELGRFYIRATGAAELYVPSCERALMAVTFFDRYLPRTVARITDLDVANRLFSVDNRDLSSETVFETAEAELCRQVEEREAFLADPQQVMADFHRQFSGEERKPLPELERFPTHFYEDGIESLSQTVKLRQHLAMESWLGDRDVTMMDLILKGSSPRKAAASHGMVESQASTRIVWDFGPDVPVRDFFEGVDLTQLSNLVESVESFIHNMETDLFRCWESVIREEQELATMPVLFDLAAELLDFGDPKENAPVHYIDDLPRFDRPWYEILRRIAPQLAIERIRTADVCDDVFFTGWPRIATWVEQRARGLSLPDGVRRPLDVVPEELRHRLWFQACCDPLCGLDEASDLTLADEEQHWRIDLFLDLLRRHRDSAEFLGLTLDNLLQRCELPERDRPIFLRTVRDRLGAGGTDEPLAPTLAAAAMKTDEPQEPITRLSNQDIRRAMLHAEPVVFRLAMRYCANTNAHDTSLAPVVIESMKAMDNDRDREFASICLSRLAQTDETSQWVLQELTALQNSGEEGDRYRRALASALLAAVPSFLAEYKQNIFAAMSDLDPRLPADVEARISDSKLDLDERWNAFVRLIHDNELFIEIDDFYPRREFVGRVERLIRGMGDDERPARWVMEILPRTINEEGYSSARELIAVSLAGTLGLTDAIPYLVTLLHDDDQEMVQYAVRSLSTIGGDAVIDALDRWFADAELCFQEQAATVLQYMDSDHGVRALQRWSSDSEDESTQCCVQQALLEQFVISEIAPTHQWMIDANPRCHEVGALRRALVANALIAGRDFPELEDWLAAVREDLASEPSPEDEDEDEWDDEDPWDDDQDEEEEEDEDESGVSDTRDDPFSRSRPEPIADDLQLDRGLSSMLGAPAAPIVNRGSKIGRNDPCPCGSGKKYKKCCLKQR